jgi:hypothetical protein
MSEIFKWFLLAIDQRLSPDTTTYVAAGTTSATGFASRAVAAGVFGRVGGYTAAPPVGVPGLKVIAVGTSAGAGVIGDAAGATVGAAAGGGGEETWSVCVLPTEQPGSAKMSRSATKWMPTTTPKILRIFMEEGWLFSV